MGYSDALAYLHGTGSSIGPITATVNALTGVSQSGTTLTYTLGTGQVVVGQTYTVAVPEPPPPVRIAMMVTFCVV